ncbi:hypothetical protein CDAR_556791 [Caerostris darwini]|uniref:Uncharacterized protein n=1 Tax=Caerostris darwini TaxID=1538125 RepID=A0AAV4RF94_9ARAC|nr:hypothetical protein CDAR_556791 [Caerostris darwini]
MSKISIPSLQQQSIHSKLPRTPFGEAIKAPTAVDKGVLTVPFVGKWENSFFSGVVLNLETDYCLSRMFVWGELNSLLLAFPRSPWMASMPRCC